MTPMSDTGGVRTKIENTNRPALTPKPKPLPWDKMKSSQARGDRLAALIYDDRLSGAQRQTLRRLIKLQKAALRMRVTALGLAHKAGYLVRAADARGGQLASASGQRNTGYLSTG